jgi:hypothetical protein
MLSNGRPSHRSALFDKDQLPWAICSQLCCLPPLTHDDFLDIENKRMSNRLYKCLIHVSIELTIAYLKDWYGEANKRVTICMNAWYMYQSS